MNVGDSHPTRALDRQCDAQERFQHTEENKLKVLLNNMEECEGHIEHIIGMLPQCSHQPSPEWDAAGEEDEEENDDEDNNEEEKKGGKDTRKDKRDGDGKDDNIKKENSESEEPKERKPEGRRKGRMYQKQRRESKKERGNRRAEAQTENGADPTQEDKTGKEFPKKEGRRERRKEKH